MLVLAHLSRHFKVLQLHAEVGRHAGADLAAQLRLELGDMGFALG